MFVEGRKMHTNRTHQPLTYDVRLPDDAQADTLRLLDASRAVVNQAFAILWPHLDEFGRDRVGPAWKQVGKYIGSPSPHGDRQWRCESEVVGRVLRAQAERKKAFERCCPFSLMASFVPKRRSDRPARTGQKSARPLPPCTRAWKKMKRALSRWDMVSSKPAIIFSSMTAFLRPMRSCNHFRS